MSWLSMSHLFVEETWQDASHGTSDGAGLVRGSAECTALPLQCRT